MSVDVDKLSNAISEELGLYSNEIIEGVNKSIDTVSKECDEEIKKHIEFRQPTGKYVKAFTIKTTSDGRFNKTKTWFVKAPYYRLTHLLENGHAKINGERTKAFPHIKFGEDIALKRLPELVEEVIKNAGH